MPSTRGSTNSRGASRTRVARRRTLVRSKGPGPDMEEPGVRMFRIAVPLLAIGVAVAIGAVFFAGQPGRLDPRGGAR